MGDVFDVIGQYPRRALQGAETPLEPLQRLSEHLGIDLWIKRDDLTGLGGGGNKVRQLEYYLGAAVAAGADTILITGAVQSNYVRTAAAAAARCGMAAVLQLEERVPGKGAIYRSSGNVLLSQILGATHMRYPEGEDEAGADRALRDQADALRAEGKRPYVIPLGLDNRPLGALGYMQAAREVLGQEAGFDVAVVPSGSGATHMGFLAGLRALGSAMPVWGICVRRDAKAQGQRLEVLSGKLTDLLGQETGVTPADIQVYDGTLAPGYGRIGETTRAAIRLMARSEGLFLDPVYTGKSFAGLIDLVAKATIPKGARVLFLHTGGTPALFAYQDEVMDL